MASIFGYIVVGLCVAATLFVVVPYIMTIVEFFNKDIRQSRIKRFNEWIKKVTPNSTQKSALMVLTVIAFLAWGLFYRG